MSTSGLFLLASLACLACVCVSAASGAGQCSPIVGCSEGACSCLCQKRGGNRALLKTADATAAVADGTSPAADGTSSTSSTNSAVPATAARHRKDNSLAVGDVCVPSGLFGGGARSGAGARWGCGGSGSSGSARCSKHSTCRCNCVANNAAPLPGDDFITLVDPEGPVGVGAVTLDVLTNDADPDGDPFAVAAYWIIANSDGAGSDGDVTVLGLSAGGQGIKVSIPDGANGFALEYVLQDARGALSAPARVQVTVTAPGAPKSYPFGSSTKPACQGYSACKNTFEKGDYKSNNECTQAGGTCDIPPTSAKCVQDRWANDAKPSYCLNSMVNNCGAPGTSGCTKCSIYRLALKCAAGGSGLTDCTRFPSTSPTHVIIRTSERDSNCKCDNGKGLCLCTKHWLMMPVKLCRGVEDGGQSCTGDDSIAFWSDAYAYGTSKLGSSNTWALQINSPDQRGQQHMHIHIATIVKATGPVGVMRSAASIAGTVASPQRFPASGSGPYLLAAFFPSATVADIKIGGKIRPFEQALLMHYNHFTNAEEAANTAFGVGILPFHKGGIVLFTAYDFSDVDYLSVEVDTSKCATKCAAFS